MEKKKRYILDEDRIPRQWYNIQAEMPNKPMPPLNPATHEPLKPEDLYPIFAEELCRQELNQQDAWVDSSIAPHGWCAHTNWKRPLAPLRTFTSRTKA